MIFLFIYYCHVDSLYLKQYTIVCHIYLVFITNLLHWYWWAIIQSYTRLYRFFILFYFYFIVILPG